MFAITGALYLLVEMLDFFGAYTRDSYNRYTFVIVICFAVVAAVVTRRPVSRILYSVPKKDLNYEVIIGDLLEASATNIVISTNDTFDTKISNGLISKDSLQGKFTIQFFDGNTEELDSEIEAALKDVPYADHSKGKGKKRKYPIGTVAKIATHGKTFYFVAMSELNENGTAHSTASMIDNSLERLWAFMASRGELGDVAIALIGTGRGRVRIPRKKVAEKIAQSFADACQEKIFANKLTIFVYPADAEKFAVNLFEIRDYFAQSLHV